MAVAGMLKSDGTAQHSAATCRVAADEASNAPSLPFMPPRAAMISACCCCWSCCCNANGSTLGERVVLFTGGGRGTPPTPSNLGRQPAPPEAFAEGADTAVTAAFLCAPPWGCTDADAPPALGK
eukprot:6491184-Amphidinium_carterae.3